MDVFAIAVKPQIAFDEAYGAAGVAAFEATLSYARARGLVRITDAKRGDGGDTAEAYADGHLGEVPFWGTEDGQSLKKIASPIRSDALTVQPWIAEACFKPFLRAIKEHGTGVFVVDKTSFKPNSRIEQTRTESGRTNWETLAELVQELGVGTEGQYGYRNFGVVMGATYPSDAPTMRHILPNSWFLIPGYGAQGGGADDAVAGINEDGLGGVVNSARAVIYAYLKGKFQ
ncbi:MAG: orotidine-5'-phosphate decarboxylase, partial [Candidatus Sungbacteria bacterium]|nr:orotidine-5'-phosphate decarboxylase [Candidatus Sungbacteria bacterium]